MRRISLALGASVIAMALPASAAATTPEGDNTGGSKGSNKQEVDRSIGAVQVGSSEVNAPVRVLSDGDNEHKSSGSKGSNKQEIDRSIGAVQVGSSEVNAPVRVLSDGDNERC